jgi:hypothetical protein
VYDFTQFVMLRQADNREDALDIRLEETLAQDALSIYERTDTTDAPDALPFTLAEIWPRLQALTLYGRVEGHDSHEAPQAKCTLSSAISRFFYWKRLRCGSLLDHAPPAARKFRV